MKIERLSEITSDFMCFRCKHLRVLSGGYDVFPDGIPYIIAEEGKKHL